MRLRPNHLYKTLYFGIFFTIEFLGKGNNQFIGNYESWLILAIDGTCTLHLYDFLEYEQITE